MCNYSIEERYELDERDPWHMDPPFEWAIENWKIGVVFEYYPEKTWDHDYEWVLNNRLSWVLQNRREEAWRLHSGHIVEICLADDMDIEEIKETWGPDASQN